MKKILKELCIGLFTIVLLNSSNLVNVFAAENSSVSEIQIMNKSRRYLYLMRMVICGFIRELKLKKYIIRLKKKT